MPCRAERRVVWLEFASGRKGTASVLVATAKAAAPRVSVTWSKRRAYRLASPRARGRDPNSSGDSAGTTNGNLNSKAIEPLGGRWIFSKSEARFARG